jgi:hypothetical protein
MAISATLRFDARPHLVQRRGLEPHHMLDRTTGKVTTIRLPASAA